MWTASIKNVVRYDDQAKITVAFTDDAITFEKNYVADFESASVDWFKRQIRLKLKALEDIAALANNLAPGAIDATEPVPAPVDDAQAAWLSGYRKLQKLQNFVTLGLLENTDTKVVTLRDLLKTGFKPEYLDLI